MNAEESDQKTSRVEDEAAFDCVSDADEVTGMLILKDGDKELIVAVMVVALLEEVRHEPESNNPVVAAALGADEDDTNEMDTGVEPDPNELELAGAVDPDSGKENEGAEAEEDDSNELE